MKSLRAYLGVCALTCNLHGSPLDSWTAGTNRNDSMIAAAVGNGVIVTATESANYLISTNGLGWYQVTTGINTAAKGMIFDGQRFLSIGSVNLGISTNGINWISRRIGDSSSLNSITYGNGVYVIVGEGGAIWRSEDALFWENQSSIVNSQLVSVKYVKGKFVAVGPSRVIESTDGRVWSDISAASIYNWTAVGGNDDKIIAIATTGKTLVHDDNGWHMAPIWTDKNLHSITERNGIFFIGDLNGTVWQSKDGTNWVGFATTSSTPVKSLAFANRRMIAFTGHGARISGQFPIADDYEFVTQLGLTPTLAFNSLAGSRYLIESAETATGPWRLEAEITGKDGQTTWSAQHLPAADQQRFFRISTDSE